jgi:L-serine dehydratase
VKISEEMKLSFEESAIIFDDIVTDYKFSNTMVCIYQHLGGELRMQYYSVGGGFIEWEGWELPETGEPPYPYSTFEGLLVQLKKSGLGIAELLLENEKAISGMTEKEIATKLDHTVNTMISAVNRGLVTIGTLPGSIQLKRKSNKVMEKAKSLNSRQDKFLRLLNAYCLAASEENAAGNIVVTAPTSGASGVIPGILYLMRHHYKIKKEKLREAMLVASSIGFLVKHNASISGAEAGCMGEVGTASGMGAAMIAYLKKEDIRTIEIAAEIAIEHHLGMTCDPVGGYVQIPCIERNAVGGVKAYNAWLLASSGVNDTQIISLDRVIRVVKETGKDMSKKYKETSEGGLALSMTEC